MSSGFSFPRFPKRPHKSGQARIRLCGQDVYLGVWGSDESRREYARLAAAHAANPKAPPAVATSVVTVSDVFARWHLAVVAERGEDWRDLAEYRRGIQVANRLYGPAPAGDFGTQQLAAARDAMVSGAWMTDDERAWRVKHKRPVGWCRNVANHQTTRLRTIWRWAEEHGLVPAGSWNHLRALRPIPRHSQLVRHTVRRTAVEWERVEPILGLVTPAVQALLRLQWIAGMRPSEVVRIRVRDITTDGPEGTWLYWLDGHKNDWRPGEECGEAVVFGEDALVVLRPWLEAARLRGQDAYLFPPSRGRSTHYTIAAYDRAVARACLEADVTPWCPYQLRHACKKRLTRDHGLDVARAQLRQRSLSTTNEYDKTQDIDLAARAAKKTG